MKRLLLLVLSVCFACLSFKKGADSTKRLVQIAKEYKRYNQVRNPEVVVTDSVKYRNAIRNSSNYNWTVMQCLYSGKKESGYHLNVNSTYISNALAARSSHGNKLYKLFVKDDHAYRQNGPAGQPLGQVLVKETWNVREVVYDAANKEMVQVQSRNDGKWYTPTTVSELFVMYKERETARNDKGWNYGTYSLEAEDPHPQLLNNIKRSSCIGCHKETKYDRIFGIQ